MDGWMIGHQDSQNYPIAYARSGLCVLYSLTHSLSLALPWKGKGPSRALALALAGSASVRRPYRAAQIWASLPKLLCWNVHVLPPRQRHMAFCTFEGEHETPQMGPGGRIRKRPSQVSRARHQFRHRGENVQQSTPEFLHLWQNHSTRPPSETNGEGRIGAPCRYRRSLVRGERAWGKSAETKKLHIRYGRCKSRASMIRRKQSTRRCHLSLPGGQSRDKTPKVTCVVPTVYVHTWCMLRRVNLLRDATRRSTHAPSLTMPCHAMPWLCHARALDLCLLAASSKTALSHKFV